MSGVHFAFVTFVYLSLLPHNRTCHCIRVIRVADLQFVTLLSVKFYGTENGRSEPLARSRRKRGTASGRPRRPYCSRKAWCAVRVSRLASSLEVSMKKNAVIDHGSLEVTVETLTTNSLFRARSAGLRSCGGAGDVRDVSSTTVGHGAPGPRLGPKRKWGFYSLADAWEMRVCMDKVNAGSGASERSTNAQQVRPWLGPGTCAARASRRSSGL